MSAGSDFPSPLQLESLDGKFDPTHKMYVRFNHFLIITCSDKNNPALAA